MARPLRIEVEDGVYHVTSRGLERRAIVADDADRKRWVGLLRRTAERREWRVLAWALMDNHFHLFVQTPRGDLSAGMHDLNSGYVTGFNHRHERVGPLYQGRFKAILVEREYHYWELSRYIHLNPVRAGSTKRAEDYRWSSCRSVLGLRAAPVWLAWEEMLREHGRNVQAARRAYRQFLSEGLLSPAESPLKRAEASALLGTPGFVSRIKAWLQDRGVDREIPTARQLRVEPSPEEIAGLVSRAYDLSPDALRVRGKKQNEARSVAVCLCRKFTRTPIKDIGAFFGGVSGSAVSHIVRQIEHRRSKSRTLQRRLSELDEQLARFMGHMGSGLET